MANTKWSRVTVCKFAVDYDLAYQSVKIGVIKIPSLGTRNAQACGYDFTPRGGDTGQGIFAAHVVAFRIQKRAAKRDLHLFVRTIVDLGLDRDDCVIVGDFRRSHVSPPMCHVHRTRDVEPNVAVDPAPGYHLDECSSGVRRTARTLLSAPKFKYGVISS